VAKSRADAFCSPAGLRRRSATIRLCRRRRKRGFGLGRDPKSGQGLPGGCRRVLAQADHEGDPPGLDGLLAHCAPNAVWYGYAPEPIDNNGYRAAIGAFLDGFTDSRFPVQALVAEGDRVACVHQLVGTHLGTFQGVPASGRPVRVTGIAIFRPANGQVAETWLSADLVGLMMQIGAIPAPGAA